MRRTEDIGDTMAEYFGLEKQASEQTSNSNSKKKEEKQQIELKGSPADMLLQLNEYKQKGLITEKEFQDMKKQILGL